jgi:hypothetical protein
MTLGPITGFGCMIGETPGILDAGIPHYRLGSVHLERGVTISTGEKVSLWGTTIGKVMEYHKGLAIFESLPTEIRLNKHIIRGLSFHLWVGMHPLIMLIPQKPVNFSWCRKDEMLIHMRRTDSS